MAKKSRKSSESVAKVADPMPEVQPRLVADEKVVDPSLALLFASSAGPVKAPPKARYEAAVPITRKGLQTKEADLDDESEDIEEEDDDISDVSDDEPPASPQHGHTITDEAIADSSDAQNRNRKRKRNVEDDVEGRYMQRLAKEEEEEEQTRRAEREQKRQRVTGEEPSQDAGSDDGTDDGNDSAESVSSSRKAARESWPTDVPRHEALVPDKGKDELEKASRTVFLANVSTTAIMDKKAKKTLLEHMGSFLDSLPVQEGKPKHTIESIRFRSTAYAGNSLPKKASFVKKNLMEETTKSTNAYVVYSTAFAAREAVKRLNATMVLDRHLRVDGVAHPAKIDHRRCVFVGNLGFVDDESLMEQGGEDARKRSKIPSDIEEGLWRQFGKAGAVESVRVVRDEKTRVGKGFAYVQFQDANAVEAALLFNEKKYPPMLPRILRVTRAKALKKTASAQKSDRPARQGSEKKGKDAVYNPKLSSERQSLQGRAARLLGKAGAAQLKGRDEHDDQANKRIAGIAKSPEDIVLEGYRATPKSGRPKDLKFGKAGGAKRKADPRSKSRKRASDWKKKGASAAK